MRKNEMTKNQTFGVGYATVIMIFVIICLSIMALLSYNAAGMNESLARNNNKYITSYYYAENRVTERVAKLDEAAYNSHASPFFEESFEYSAEELGYSPVRCPDGYTVSFSENINDRLMLYVNMKFYSDPSAHGGRRYAIEEYRTMGVSDEDEDAPSLGLWNGNAPLLLPE